MKRFFWIILLITICSCTENKNKKNEAIIFNKGNAVKIKNTALQLEDSIILDYKDIPLTPLYSCLLSNKENYFLLDKVGGQVLRFSKKGSLMNIIGKRGQGAEEILKINDVRIDEKEKQILILGDRGIGFYNFNGVFISKNKLPASTFSFCKSSTNCFFLFGYNTLDQKKYKIAQTDKTLKIKNRLFPIENKQAPFMERNFYQYGRNITFKESLSSDVYRVEGEVFSKAYSIDFKELKIPMEYFNLSPLQFMQKLMKINYATVKEYLENSKYSLMQIVEYEKGNLAKIYYWIINKSTQEQKIIQLENTFMEFYGLYPQFLTEDNLIYFIGYKDEIDLDNKKMGIYISGIESLI